MHAGANPRVGWASIFCLAASWRARPLGTKVMGCTQPEAIHVWAGWPLAASRRQPPEPSGECGGARE